MIPPVDFLKDSLSVTLAEDGLVAVTVLLPPELTHDYCRFLDSLASFFQTVNRKSSIVRIAARVAESAPERDAAIHSVKNIFCQVKSLLRVVVWV